MNTAGTLRTSKTIPPFGYDDYVRFSALVRRRCGLQFSETRRDDLERGVRQAFAASTCTDLNEYYRLLQDPESSLVHVERLINALTLSETHFFRSAHLVDALYHHVLPQLIERRRPSRTLRIWNAGCGGGEETYSLAMLLRELLPDVDEWRITILGTDINTKALDRARRASYSEWAFPEERDKEGTASPLSVVKWRRRYFRRRGNRYELVPEARRMVTFRKLNLVEDDYPSYESNTISMDLILCQNVLTYFTKRIARRIAERFYDCLVPDGWLGVGHAEQSLAVFRRFRARNFPGAILYQRGSESPSRVSEGQRPSPPPSAAGHVVERKPSTPTIEEEEEEESELTHVYIHALGRLGHVDLIGRAQELLGHGRSEEARDLLLGLIEAGPADASTCTLLGQAHCHLSHWEEAERWCREAIRLDILALDAYYILALVLQHQGQLDEAIDAMKKVIYIDQHHPLAHFDLATLYHAKVQLPQALKSLDDALRQLDGRDLDDFIPGSFGITAGSLRETIIHHQQTWRTEAVTLSAAGQDRERLANKLRITSQEH